ncbi:hypothetical protein KR044_005132, partial [Drosophila immigrans]
VNLLSVSYGASFGWDSAMYRKLPIYSRDGLNYFYNMESRIMSLTVGVLIGAILFGWLAERIGRRRCLLLMVIPAVLKWLLVIFASHIEVVDLYVERLIAGSVGGCCFAVIPIYITEMTEDRHRSTLGTFMSLSMLIGMLLIHILGYFLNYETAAGIMLLIPLAFFGTLFYIPDTPEYLERYHKEGVEKSVRFFRGITSSEQLQVELTKLCKPVQTLENGNQSQTQDNNLRLGDFTNRKALKAFFIGLGILLAKQLTGYLRLVNYKVYVFRNLPPNEGSFIVIIIQLVGAFLATLLVEKVGRKTLLLISTAGICLGEVALAFHSYLGQLIVDTSPFDWMPIVTFSLIMFSGAIGITAVDFVVITEIAPPKIRSLIVRVQIVIFAFVFIVILKSTRLWGIYFTYFVLIFAAVSFLYTILIALFVPKTKGKSIEAIQTSL